MTWLLDCVRSEDPDLKERKYHPVVAHDSGEHGMAIHPGHTCH
jgi:hypothetical protein